MRTAVPPRIYRCVCFIRITVRTDVSRIYKIQAPTEMNRFRRHVVRDGMRDGRNHASRVRIAGAATMAVVVAVDKAEGHTHTHTHYNNIIIFARSRYLRLSAGKSG